MLVGMPNVIQTSASAKVNLALWVGDVGDEGMHPICSWMVSLDLCDELTLHRLEPGGLSRYAILWHEEALQKSEINWPIKNDLAVRAHLALQAHVGRVLPLQLKLEKRIPVGGGLGGGSSDAAATLRGLNLLFDLNVSDEKLAAIGAEIGSDIPFFMTGSSALVEGLGERVTIKALKKPIYLAVFFPAVSCHTGQVYQMFDELPQSATRPQQIYDMIDSPVDPQAMFNDLTAAACCIAPILEQHIEKISALANRPVAVSGSGSTLFVICDDLMHAEALVEAANKEFGLPGLATATVQDPTFTAGQ
jgi:4-diphosphocytidyl-2-C-methyl-D-erythritol kinase